MSDLEVTQFGGNAKEQLRSYIKRIETLAEEKDGLQTDIKDIFAEAKGNGFDAKIMRIVIKRRKMEAQMRAEQDAMTDLYSDALGVPVSE